MTTTKHWAIVAVVLTAASPAFGATIAAWDFLDDAQPIADGRNPNTLDANVVSTLGLSRGNGLVAASLVRAFSSSGWNVATKDDAIAGGNFLTFTLDASSGNKASYDLLDYKVRRSSTGANAFIWQYQIDSGPFVDIETAQSYTGTETNGVFFQDDLSTIAALQNATAAITFRFVAWGGTSTDGTLAIGRNGSGVAGDTLILSGEVSPVPEPSCAVLLLLGSLVAVARRR